MSFVTNILLYTPDCPFPLFSLLVNPEHQMSVAFVNSIFVKYFNKLSHIVCRTWFMMMGIMAFDDTVGIVSEFIVMVVYEL